jgi:hypothetical protein
MGELDSLLLVLAAIYAAECLTWVPLGALAFTRWHGRVWRLRQPSPLAGNARGGMVLAHPLPPLGTVVHGRLLPLSLSPEGACVWNPACLNGSRRPPQRGAWLPFAAMREVATLGKKVLVNGQCLLQAGSESYAAFLAGLLRQLLKVDPGQRAEAIRQIMASQLDQERVSARLAEATRRARPLQWLANGLFLSVFALVPAVVWQFGLRRVLWALVVGVLAQTLVTAVLYYRAHQALLPAAKEERFAWCLTMILAAPTAMRAHDLLLRRVFESFHPLVLARVLGHPDRFRELAGLAWRDGSFPMEPFCPDLPPEAGRCVAWAHRAWLEVLRAFFKKSGLAADDLLASPPPSEPEHISFCPRCRTQYVLREGCCAECGGRKLVALKG